MRRNIFGHNGWLFLYFYGIIRDYIGTCRGLCVNYKTRLRLDGWIFCTLYIHTTRDYRQYSSIADLRTLQFTVTHAVVSKSSLVVSWQWFHHSLTVTSNRIWSLFFHSLTPFLPLFCNCHFRRLDSVQFLCSQAGQAGISKLDSTETFFITTLYGPQRKHSFYCLRGVFTDRSPINGRPIIARVCFRGNMFTKSLPSNGCTRHNIMI
jgi:hypothetical protein